MKNVVDELEILTPVFKLMIYNNFKLVQNNLPLVYLDINKAFVDNHSNDQAMILLPNLFL